MRKPLIGLLGVVALVSVTPPAHAAFPGANGKIAFTSDRDGNHEVYSMTSAGGAQTNMTNNPGETDRSPAWTADGGAIAFSGDPSGPAWHQIYRMNADGTGRTQVSTIDVWSHDEPSWSPDGAQIAAHANRDPGATQFDIVVMNADGTGETVLTADSSGPDVDPAWSPDGGRIAFSSRRGASSMDIYVMWADGSSPVELTSSLASESQPNWSPDGQRIAFVSEACTPMCAASIHVIKADGTGEVTLTSGTPSDASPVWSPDGSKIAFERFFPGPNRAIHVMNADGSGEVQIGGNPAQDTDPDWQPLVTGYPRPKGASPTRVSLVPAYAQCAAPNRTHGPPLGFPSCNPPGQASSNLTIGTPDANGAPANSSGWFRIDVVVGPPGLPDDSGAPISMSLSDVRCKVGVSTCGSANAGGGADYTGELQAEFTLRMTDKWNATVAGGGPDPATVTDFTFPVPVLCTSTASTAEGAKCETHTDALYLIPGSVKDGKRAIWEMSQVRVLDGGPDGDIDTSDNSLFAVQGLFVP